MDVSIVIVNYNTGKLLDECIQSIKRETTVSYEIIVVDNASMDNSCQMLREKYPEVRLIENRENVGFARANNQGFAIASGKYFFMLNPDTVILDHAIDKLFAFMEVNLQAGICAPRNEDQYGHLQLNCDHFPSLFTTLSLYLGLSHRFPAVKILNKSRMAYWEYKQTRDVDKVMGCSLMIRSEVFKLANGLDNNYFMYFEETDLCFRVKQRGYRVVFVPEARLLHYGGQSAVAEKTKGVFNQTILQYYLTSKYYFYRKNYGIILALMARILDMTYGAALFFRNICRKDMIKSCEGMQKGKALMRHALGRGA